MTEQVVTVAGAGWSAFDGRETIVAAWPTDPGTASTIASGSFKVSHVIGTTCGPFEIALFIDADASGSCTQGDPVTNLQGVVYGGTTISLTPDSSTSDGSSTAGTCASFGPGFHLRFEHANLQELTGCHKASVRVIDTSTKAAVMARSFPSWQTSVSLFHQGLLVAGRSYEVFTFVDSDGVPGCTSGDAVFVASIPPVVGQVKIALPGVPADNSACAVFQN